MNVEFAGQQRVRIRAGAMGLVAERPEPNLSAGPWRNHCKNDPVFQGTPKLDTVVSWQLSSQSGLPKRRTLRMKISGLPSKKNYALHHLPTQGQNLFYTFFLILSPLLNIAVNIFVFEDFRRISSKGVHEYNMLTYISEISGCILGAIVVLLAINLMFVLRRHHHIRRSLLLFGAFSSAYLLINLATVSYGIFAFNVQAMPLLLVSAGIYCSLNIVMLFWYWYFDYPDQVRRLYHSDHFTELIFPEGPSNHHKGWVPNFLDYLYFTVMMSNTLGPPENHSAAGAKAKAIQLIHSTTMLLLLVIFISRAINTLSA